MQVLLAGSVRTDYCDRTHLRPLHPSIAVLGSVYLLLFDAMGRTFPHPLRMGVRMGLRIRFVLAVIIAVFAVLGGGRNSVDWAFVAQRVAKRLVPDCHSDRSGRLASNHTVPPSGCNVEK